MISHCTCKWNCWPPRLGHCYYFLCFSSHRNSKSYAARWKKNNLGQKKKVLRLPTSSSSSGDSVFQALNGCFSLQHCGIMLHFCSKHIKKKKKKKAGKEVKCQTDLAEGDNHVSTYPSWYCSWVSCVKLWNMNSSILHTLPSFSRQCRTGLPLSSI